MKELYAQLAEEATTAVSSLGARATAAVALIAAVSAINVEAASGAPTRSATEGDSLVCHKDPSSLLPQPKPELEDAEAPGQRIPLGTIRVGQSSVRLFTAEEMPQRRGCKDPQKPKPKLRDRIPSKPAPRLPKDITNPAPIPLGR